MITINQFQQGLLRYIDTDIMPHLTGLKKIGLGVYVTLAANNISTILEKYKNRPAIEMLGVIDSENNIDIDNLYRAILPMMAEGQKIPIEIPMIGEIRVDKTDLDKIYQYMRG